MKIGAIGLAVLLIAGLISLGYVEIRDRLNMEREDINTEWRGLDTELQSRADMIPNFLEFVKGHPKEAAGVFDSLSRSAGILAGAKTRKEKIEANTTLANGLIALREILRKHQNLRMQRSLEDAENRILQARRRYNDAVKSYNTDLALFPGNIVASLSDLRREDAYFKTEPGAGTAPEVQF